MCTKSLRVAPFMFVCDIFPPEQQRELVMTCTTGLFQHQGVSKRCQFSPTDTSSFFICTVSSTYDLFFTLLSSTRRDSKREHT